MPPSHLGPPASGATEASAGGLRVRCLAGYQGFVIHIVSFPFFKQTVRVVLMPHESFASGIIRGFISASRTAVAMASRRGRFHPGAPCPAASSSNNACASFKSAVSKASVNQA